MALSVSETHLPGGRTVSGLIHGAPTHNHRPIKLRNSTTACADCGVMIFEKRIALTGYEASWQHCEQE